MIKEWWYCIKKSCQYKRDRNKRNPSDDDQHYGSRVLYPIKAVIFPNYDSMPVVLIIIKILDIRHILHNGFIFLADQWA